MSRSNRAELKRVQPGDIVKCVRAPVPSDTMKKGHVAPAGPLMGGILITHAGAQDLIGYAFTLEDLQDPTPARAIHVSLMTRRSLAKDDDAGEVLHWAGFHSEQWPLPLFERSHSRDGTASLLVLSPELEELFSVSLAVPEGARLPGDGYPFFPAQDVTAVLKWKLPPPPIIDARNHYPPELRSTLTQPSPPEPAKNKRQRTATAGKGDNPMDETTFWKLIDETRAEAGRDDNKFLETLKERLAVLEPSDLVQFRRQLDLKAAAAYRWDLWGAVYLWEGGCSDDAFEYFRCWLVSQGKAAFERVLADPDALVDFKARTHEMEELMYLPVEVWEEKTDDDFYEAVNAAEESDPQPSEPAGEQWEEDDLPKRFPRIAKAAGATEAD